MDPRTQFPQHDRAICDWFAARGWPVTETLSYFGSAIYGWRHRGPEGCFTLYVTEEVLDRNEARDVPGLLDQRFTETALRELPGGEAILAYGTRFLTLRYFEGADR